MKSLRKSILTLLALTLFGGAGAWAQGPTNVIQLTTDMLPASWATNYNDITLEDLQDLGFEAVDVSVAQAWTGAPTSGFARLIYGFNDGSFYYIRFSSGQAGTPSHTNNSNSAFYEEVANGAKYFITTGGGAIELTKVGDNQWTLGQAPDYDVELQVEYYQKHALKNIPAGWTVKVNGVDQTSAIVGDSLMITETDSVTLEPAGNPRRVKSVTLEEDGPATQTVNIDGITLDITGCTTWADIIARNPGVIGDWDGWVSSERGVLELGGIVNTSDPYDPAQQANYHWSGI